MTQDQTDDFLSPVTSAQCRRNRDRSIDDLRQRTRCWSFRSIAFIDLNKVWLDRLRTEYQHCTFKTGSS